jgi:HmuY protein
MTHDARDPGTGARMNRFSKLIAVLLLSACGPMVTVADGGAQVDAGTDAGVTVMPRCTQPTAVSCQDQSIQKLALRQVVSTGVINEEGARPGEKTYLDGRGGGLMTPESYLYVRFTPQGLVKVDVHDEAALTSMDWDIAFRRFIIRLNAGVSGPSCVVGARTVAGTTFDALTAVPANLSWRTEEYFTGATCEFVADPSGIGGPNAALTSYWSYQSCVQMTGNVYVLHLRDGRFVKFEVLSYYDPAQQQVCNMTGAVPSPSGAANFRVRWAYLDATP